MAGSRGKVMNVQEFSSNFARGTTLNPLDKYDMTHKCPGLVLIFNQEHFNWNLNLRQRAGTNIDFKNLQSRFKNLNFTVQPYHDLKKKEVLAKIAEAAEANHVNADCFICIFLSHGEDHHVYACDEEINIQEVTAKFKGNKCPSLVGKPKIFIFQACRGHQADQPVTPGVMADSSAEVNKGVVNEVVVDAGVVNTLPSEADFLMCYSVAEGYFSFRETTLGSWYIQDLCEALMNFGRSLEFTELLTLVNKKVSLRTVHHAANPKDNEKKQMPCFASMLTKKLYLRC